jgi:hypothetical protein
MPSASKAKHTSRQKREAHHIEDSAKQLGSATANKQEHRGKNSGRGKRSNKASSKLGGKRSRRGSAFPR